MSGNGDNGGNGDLVLVLCPCDVCGVAVLVRLDDVEAAVICPKCDPELAADGEGDE